MAVDRYVAHDLGNHAKGAKTKPRGGLGRGHPLRGRRRFGEVRACASHGVSYLAGVLDWCP